jgi:hypothetical protein
MAEDVEKQFSPSFSAKMIRRKWTVDSFVSSCRFLAEFFNSLG